MPAMFVLTLDSSMPFRRTYHVRMLITFPRFLISNLKFRRELGQYNLYSETTQGSNESGLLQQAVFNPLPDMPISDSSNSAANKDMMSNI